MATAPRYYSDGNANRLFLADELVRRRKYRAFFEAFANLSTELGIRWTMLPGTKEIWVRDYMPLQIERGRFVLFDYSPDYWTTCERMRWGFDPTSLCETLGINPARGNLVLEGGNFVREGQTGIMTDKALSSFAGSAAELDQYLRRLLDLDKLILIP